MSSVLVTGGLGVIGAWVSRRLVDQGHEVVTYSRHIDTSLVKDITGKITMVSGDVLDLPAILRTIKEHNIDRIVHMATALPDALDANPYNAYRTNVNGIMNLLEAARLVEIKRFIFSSSVAVYDAARGEYAYPTYKGIDEDYPKVPTTVYGATKLFAENMTIIYNERFGVDSIILRFASVYGPGKQVRHGLLALHSKIIESALLNRPLKIRQGGDDKIDMVYVKDIANAVVLACFATSPEHRVFHVGTGRGDTFRHLGEVVNRLTGNNWIDICPGLNPFQSPKIYPPVFNIDRVKRELGYVPQYDLETAVVDYIDTLKRLNISPMVVS